jgi:hypothetical protein
MTKEDVKKVERIVLSLEEMKKNSNKLFNREHIDYLKAKVKKSSLKDKRYICDILEGTLSYGITLKEAISLLKRLETLTPVSEEA